MKIQFEIDLINVVYIICTFFFLIYGVIMCLNGENNSGFCMLNGLWCLVAYLERNKKYLEDLF